MAKRIVLNETSYHGKGAVREIAAEVGARRHSSVRTLTW